MMICCVMADNRRQVRRLLTLSFASIVLVAFVTAVFRLVSQEKARWPQHILEESILTPSLDPLNHNLLLVSQTARFWWLYTRHQLQQLERLRKKRIPNLQERIQRIIKRTTDHTAEYYRVLQLQLEMSGDEEKRKLENKALRILVFKRLYHLQNPQNCTLAPTLTYNLTNVNGFASGVHDVLWCFVKAFSEGRRFLLTTTHWHYAPDGWETAFKPLSDTCPSNVISINDMACPRNNDDTTRHLLRTLPSDIGSRIKSLQSNPLAWFHGQLIAFLLRPNERLRRHILEQRLQIMQTQIQRQPFVGVHVRRTDKIGNEARLHHLDEYMQHAEEFFQGRELISKHLMRRIFLATDDPRVIKQCIEEFSTYRCLHQIGSAVTALNLDTRYSNSSLWSVLTDLFILADSDYLVCTFSSGLCRLAFELMHAIGRGSPSDVAQRAVSLDVPHHYAWVLPVSRRALYHHQVKSEHELGFEKGELLLATDEYSTIKEALQGHSTNGFLERTRSRDWRKGDIPVYKTVPIYEYIDFPTDQ